MTQNTETKSEQSASENSAAAFTGRKPGVLISAALIPCIASFVFSLWPTNEPPLTVTKSRSALVFSTHMYHHGDLPVKQQSTLESEFIFRNDGSESVTIGEIERSCGCMSPRVSSRIVAPGEVGSIRVPIATINQSPGPHEFSLTVNYTDPQPRQTTLNIKAIFPKKMVVVQPKALYLSQKSEKPFDLPGITISDFRTAALSVDSVISTAPFISATLKSNSANAIVQTSHSSDTPGSETKITGKVAGDIPPGRHHALVAATTGDPEFPVIAVPMIVNGPAFPDGEAAVLAPAQFRMEASTASVAIQTVRLQLKMPSDWEISHATSWPDQLSVKYSDGQKLSDNETLVVVDVALTELPPANLQHGVIQLHANDGRDLVTAKANFEWP